ncbi:MAG: tripartite tricarboxylate transporter substrate-binding protein [Hyphomicrobiaceae bacterium]
MKLTRRAVSAGILATGLMPASAARAEQRFPGGQPIKVIVGFPAGGSQDIVGRLVAERLSAYWSGVPVVVENVPGAGSNLAFDRVARGPTDGTQILIVPPPFTTNQFLYAKIAHDPVRDFIPLALLVTFPNLLCVRNSLPVRTLPELIAYAKANPGKLNYGSTGIGTSPHLASEMLKRMAGIEFATVHHRGSAPTINSLLSEAVDFAMDNSTSITPHARAGSVRAIGIATLRRWPLGEEFVPIAETLPGYEAQSFSGLAVRAGTPKAICDEIEAAAIAVTKVPVFRERTTAMMAEVVGTGADAFATFLTAERAKWGKLITDLGLKRA